MKHNKYKYTKGTEFQLRPKIYDNHQCKIIDRAKDLHANVYYCEYYIDGEYQDTYKLLERTIDENISYGIFSII